MGKVISIDWQVEVFVKNHPNCRTSEVVNATGLTYKPVYMALRRSALRGKIERVAVHGKGRQERRWIAADDCPPAADRGWFRKANQ